MIGETPPEVDAAYDDTEGSWLPDEAASAPLEVDAADWIDQERSVPPDPSDEAPR